MKKVDHIIGRVSVWDGEYPFIRTELEKLVERFEICIMSVSSSTEQKMMTNERISVYHCMRTFGIPEKLEAVVKFFFSRCGHKVFHL